MTGDVHPSFFSSIVALSWSLARWLEVQASQKSQYTSASKTIVQALQKCATLYCKQHKMLKHCIARGTLLEGTHDCKLHKSVQNTSARNTLLVGIYKHNQHTFERKTLLKGTHFWKEHTFARYALLQGTRYSTTHKCRMIGGARNTLLVTLHPFLVTLLHHLMSGSQLHRLMSGRMGGGLISGRRRKRVTGTHPDTGALCKMAALVPAVTSYISGWKCIN